MRSRDAGPFLEPRWRSSYKTGVSAPQPASLPDRFRARLAEIVPAARLAGVLASFGAAKRATLRVNTLRAAEADVLAELAALGVTTERVVGLSHVHRVAPAAHGMLVRSAAFTSGRLYVQNIASLLAAPALEPAPGMAVLDLCAAPGGKTLHLAALMNNVGTLSAVESSRPRFFRLQHTLRLHGVTCARTYLKDGRGIGRLCPAQFDRVLVDAPCSGEAQLRAGGPDDLPNWSPRKIAQCAGKQRALLAAAVAACKPGGVVLYCTCSTAPEENEAVLADTLARFADEIVVEPVVLPEVAAPAAVPALPAWRGREFPQALAAAVRILPDDWFDAFFLCRLRKA